MAERQHPIDALPTVSMYELVTSPNTTNYLLSEHMAHGILRATYDATRPWRGRSLRTALANQADALASHAWTYATPYDAELQQQLHEGYRSPSLLPETTALLEPGLTRVAKMVGQGVLDLADERVFDRPVLHHNGSDITPREFAGDIWAPAYASEFVAEYQALVASGREVAES